MNNPARRPSIAVDAEPEDKILVARAQKGDTEAFEALFQRYYRRSYQLAIGVLRNADDASDVVQDAFIKAHKNLSKFEGKSSFFTWMYRIIMNLCIDHMRKKKRKRQVNVEDTASLIDHASRDNDEPILPRILGQDPGRALARKEIRAQLEVALDELSDKHRAVLIMREVEGMSYADMADVLDCSKGTIMSRLFHARKNMQASLLRLMNDEPSKENQS